MKAIFALTILLSGAAWSQYVVRSNLEAPQPIGYCKSKQVNQPLSQTRPFDIIEFSKQTLKFSVGFRALPNAEPPKYFRLYSPDNGIEFFRGEPNLVFSELSSKYDFSIPTSDFQKSTIVTFENRQHVHIALDLLDSEGCVLRYLGMYLVKNPFEVWIN